VIFGAHVIPYSNDAEADRGFLRDVLELSSVDAGHGWLIFALPTAEVAVHPTMDGASPSTEFHLMTNDLDGTMHELAAKGVRCSEVTEARWGSLTRITLPSGAEIGLYQPRHPSPRISPPT
jgi:hypothetical protein